MKPDIFQLDVRIINQTAHAGNQHIITLQASEIAQTAKPGSFVHVQCDPLLKLRRPISIMQVNQQAGTIDLLYKALGTGTNMLATKQPGETINILGPIGNGFTIDNNYTKPLLIGGGVGMPPMIFLANSMKKNKLISPLVILGSEVPFPFNIKTTTKKINGINVKGTMPLLDNLDIDCRLASLNTFDEVYSGYVTDLAREWLNGMTKDDMKKVAIYSCGPYPMLKAVYELSIEYDLPCQVSLEEFMACGVGGCAGCTVEIKNSTGTAMKRVCVDGPVFESREVAEFQI